MADSYNRMEKLYNPGPQEEHPHGWIQWKGTDVCMDIYCKCGKHLHADAEFLYFVTCGHCSRTYRVSPYVMLMELEPEELHEADRYRNHTLREDD